MDYQVSYQARLPVPGSIRVVHQEGWEFVEGVWGAQNRELFQEFWTASKKGREEPFHVQFVRCQPDAASIAEFTEKWGAVGGGAVGEPNPHGIGSLYSSHRFRISVSAWVEYQAKFKEIWGLVAKRAASRLDLQKAKQFGPLFHFGPGGRDWTGLKLSLDPVRSKNGRQLLRPTLRPTSEWVALLVMLWLEMAARKATLGICENPKCRKEFRADRANRKFCSNECAHRHHNLADYHRMKSKERKSSLSGKGRIASR